MNFSQLEAMISPHFLHHNPDTDAVRLLRLYAIKFNYKSAQYIKKVTEFYGKFSPISRNSISVKYE